MDLRYPNAWRFRAYLEWPDAQTTQPIPSLWRWDERNTDVVNSNGVAADPKRLLGSLGGTVVTGWYNNLNEFDDHVNLAWDSQRPRPNYRSQASYSFQIPGIRERRDLWRRLQNWGQYFSYHLAEMSDWMGLLRGVEATPEALAMAEQIRQKRTHLATDAQRLERLRAKTADEWSAVPLGTKEAIDFSGINKEPGIITWRCFAAPTSPKELTMTAYFALRWLWEALEDQNPAVFVNAAKGYLPRQLPFQSWMEAGWEMTNLGTNSRETVAKRLDHLKGMAR